MGSKAGFAGFAFRKISKLAYITTVKMLKSTWRQVKDDAGDKAQSIKDAVEDALGDAGDMAGRIKDAVEDALDDAGDMAGTIKDSIKNKAQDMKEKLQKKLRDTFL